MILKASQRGGGQNLAVHLMRTDDNEHVRVHELRGFASDNLKDAFKEAEAVSLGTRCRQYLFSLSLSPPEHENVPVVTFEQAIARIEKQLGLENQPRAVVFHEKEGRRHAHCVWSRIDVDTMTAKHMSFFKDKLKGVSRKLYLEQGWTMPRGLENAAERDPRNFSLAEWQQAKRQGIDPRWLKQAVQDCWKRSDNRQAFERSLEERSLFLAKGDKRGFVVLDHEGEVWSLVRMLDVKTKDVRARLGDGDKLQSVEKARETIGKRMTPSMRKLVSESREQFARKSTQIALDLLDMTRQHRSARARLNQNQKSEWEMETRERAARLPKGLRGLWHRLIGKYQEVRRQNDAEAKQTRERHADQRQTLIDKQLSERAQLQIRIKELRHRQAEQLSNLRQQLGRFLRFTRTHYEENRQLSVKPNRERGR